MLLWTILSDYPNEIVVVLSTIGSFIVRAVACLVGLALIVFVWTIMDVSKRVQIQKERVQMSNSSAWQLVKAYYKAKKDRLCPTIEFVEPSSLT